jgi:hypothetical protein
MLSSGEWYDMRRDTRLAVPTSMRKELVDRVDRGKAIRYFAATQGWSEAMVVQQVLTPSKVKKVSSGRKKRSRHRVGGVKPHNAPHTFRSGGRLMRLLDGNGGLLK